MIRAELPPSEPLRAPAWARPGGSFREISEAEALFFAGAALAALDSAVRSEPPWAGAWRRRLALKSAAAAAANLLNRREGRGGAARRDRARETRAGARAGRMGLCRLPRARRPRRPVPLERLAAIAADLQAPLDPQKAAELTAALRKVGAPGRPAPIVAAAAAEAVIAMRADAEPLALLCADAALAKSLGWPTPLPLLAGELFARRATGEGRRPRPGDAGWGKFLALSYARAALAALDLAQDLSRRTSRLMDAAPKLRAKGKERALQALLDDDAISAAAPIAGLSDRARRRLFDRLVRLSAARELTGRARSDSTGSDPYGA